MNAVQRRRAAGQDLVEYALILPIFLLILAIITDLGRITYYYSAIYNAAREAARYGIINPADTSGIEAKARSATVSMDPTDVGVGIAVDSVANTIEVTVTYQFAAITPLVETIVGANPLPISTRATMQLEQ